MDDEKLSPELVWQADGHLTDVALTALGDGEAGILPDGAATHASACAACAAALGHAALLSLRTGEAIGEARALAPAPAAVAAPASRPPGEPLPVAAILAALSLAALGAAPGFIAGAARLAEIRSQAGHAAVVVLRTGRVVLESGAVGARGWIAALMWVSAALLVMIGLAVARATRKRLSLGGGT
jgi:hypothetical protein